jgi:hypothetical protein
LDVAGSPMRVRFQLNSPAGNFDLFVYQTCDTVEKSSENATGVDSISIGPWGELGTFSNGIDDDRTYIVEVRQRRGSCTAEWTLTVEGNN